MSDHLTPVPQPFEPDAVVASALRSIPVPDHRQGFWAAVDARIAEVGAQGPTVRLDDRAGGAATSSRPRRRRPRLRAAALAAAVALLVVAGVALLVNRPENRTLEPGGTSEPTSTTAVPTPPVDPTRQAIAARVREFVATVGTDAEAAFPMLTAESQAFLSSADVLASGFAEDFGAWGAAGAIEREVVTIARAPAGVQVAVVAYTGTVEIEATQQRRTQAFAVVRENGEWRIAVTATAEAASAGPAIELTATDPIQFALAVEPGIDSVTVAIDGGEPLDPAQLELSGSALTVRPQLGPGTHVVTIAVVLPDGVVHATAVEVGVD